MCMGNYGATATHVVAGVGFIKLGKICSKGTRHPGVFLMNWRSAPSLSRCGQQRCEISEIASSKASGNKAKNWAQSGTFEIRVWSWLGLKLFYHRVLCLKRCFQWIFKKMICMNFCESHQLYSETRRDRNETYF